MPEDLLMNVDDNAGIVSFGKRPIWADILTQINTIEGNICIATYSLPDVSFAKKILAKRPCDIHIIAHSKFFDKAYELKETFPEIHIAVRDDIHAKFALIEPDIVWLSSANFGKSDWLEHAVTIHSQKLFEPFKNDFDNCFSSSKVVETLKPCPFCGTKLKLRDKTAPALQEHGSPSMYYIRCSFCGTYTGESQNTLEKAIGVWNRRANDGQQ